MLLPKVATGLRSVHRAGYAVKITAQDPPCRVADHDGRDFTAFKALLITNILVGGQQHVEPSCFGLGKELPV